jgi:hypothetical protein
MPKKTLVLENIMSTLTKKDCISVLKAKEQLSVARNTLEAYINVLNIAKHKFPLDNKVYISKVDFARIEQFVKDNSEE